MTIPFRILVAFHQNPEAWYELRNANYEYWHNISPDDYKVWQKAADKFYRKTGIDVLNSGEINRYIHEYWDPYDSV